MILQLLGKVTRKNFELKRTIYLTKYLDGNKYPP